MTAATSLPDPGSRSSLLESAPVLAPLEFRNTGHAVQFYSDESILLTQLARLVGGAIGSGDGALVIATEPRRAMLRQRLTALSVDSQSAADRGRYVLLDARNTLEKFLRGGAPDESLFTATLGPLLQQLSRPNQNEASRITAYGEMVALLWAEGKPEAAVKLEQLWNELAKDYPLFLLCSYPLNRFDMASHADFFRRICSEHSDVVPGENYTRLVSEGERLREIACYQQKAQALEREVAERQRVEAALLAGREELEKSHEDLERKVAERTRALRQTETQLRELSGRLLTLRDEERRRLARELHDSTGQILAAIQLNLGMVIDQNGAGLDAAVLAKLNEASDLSDRAIQEVRTLSYLLHPPMLDEAGLFHALDWYVEGFSRRSGITVDLDLPAVSVRLSQELEIAIFRIVQEGLTNVHRHSGSRKAGVCLEMGKQFISLTIEDAGKGFPIGESGGTKKLGVGIRGMRERVLQLGGTLEISAANPGSCLRISLPLTRNIE